MLIHPVFIVKTFTLGSIGTLPMQELTAEIEVDKAHASHWGFWGTVLWGMVIISVFVVLQIVAYGAIIGVTQGAVLGTEADVLIPDLEYDGFVLSVCTITTTLGCGILLLGVIKLKRGAVIKEYLGLTTVTTPEAVRWIAAVLVCFVVWDGLNVVLGRPVVPEFMSLAYASANPLWLLWVAVVIAAPLFEEMFFRGFLIEGFRSSFLGPIGAVVLTSALWAVIHQQYDVYDMSTIFVLGCILGGARLQTGSVLLPFGMHMLVNLIATSEAAIL